MERFRTDCEAISFTHILAFLYICENEGIMVAELATVLRMTRATDASLCASLFSRQPLSSVPSKSSATVTEDS